MRFDLPFDVCFRNRKLVRFDQPVDQFFLGFVLRGVFAFVENRLANRFAQIVQGGVVAQILGELVVQLGQLLGPDGLQLHAEPDGFTRPNVPAHNLPDK